MHIAILGAGFTGLTAALRLSKAGHNVTVFEKEDTVGGLAIGFSKPNWLWSLEKAYHHWFTNDDAVLNLARELNYKVIIKRPATDVFISGRLLPFDSPLALLKFPYLPLIDRLKVGFATAYLKTVSSYKQFENKKALEWIRRYMGIKSAELIWDPLFRGKFGNFKEDIALTWFWARIKKRTPSLAYPEGGFQTFADRISGEIKKTGGKIYLNTEVGRLINSSKNVTVEFTTNHKPPASPAPASPRGEKRGEPTINHFDKVIVTLPSPVFAKVAPQLPKPYVKKITSILHLHAQVLILILKKPFMKKTYWLNITDKSFPFLILAEHTNFMDPKYYGGEHILYIGNYLSPNHPYIKMTAEQLLRKFDPYLKKINPHYQLLTTRFAARQANYQLFIGPFAQPVVTVGYPKLKPDFETPLKNIYLANLDMVYPWDRGTNYAVEMGEKIADMIDSNAKN